ncbi:IS630 family transposase [Candidatus Tisiphia endosymbiont of Nemotelus uliginosus]|uniref:IS630 family transposase n=1 Tax=Candidatus Tisiphia endosymbiont of Nemotelus uliginosus TaxID=3077926 RepID=UPI0035C8880B
MTHLLKKNSKKNLHQVHQDNPIVPIYFFDETRFGPNTKHGLGWFEKGSRTPVPTKLGFKSFYLYSATNHRDGDSFSLIIPNVDKACMQVFLNEFAKHITTKVILVMDGAGWHKGLTVPANIEIMYLPPYSPELNPVERLWQHLKDLVLKNKVYDCLTKLEDAVIAFIQSIAIETIKSICNCSYIYL